ncbi:MAG: DNA translocase FtsK 4TM domain-containing protein [Pirellulaceae bacterium]|nr:DNA translocase FtsK 4TM domain-containing protein [Planctomycetales bacterium]
MFENRNLKLDLFAVGLLAFTVFIGLALATYDPADPVPELAAPLNLLHQPDRLVFPPHEQTRNLCGYWGALASDLLLTKLGVGAYFLVASLASLDYLLLRRHTVDAPLLRAVGWVATLCGLTSLFALLWPGMSPGPVIGSGGYLGALGAAMLQAHFALAGSVIICLSLMLGGLLLSTDYAVVSVAQLVFGIAAGAVMRGRSSRVAADDAADSASSRKSKRKPRELTSDELSAQMAREAAAEDAADVAVRIRGKQVAAPPADEEAEEEWDEAAEYALDEAEEDEDAEVPVSSLAAKAAEEKSASDSGISKIRDVIVNGLKKTVRDDEPESSPPPRVRDKKRGEKPTDSAREEMLASLNELNESEAALDYELPSIELLTEGDDVCFEEQTIEVRRKAKILEKTFADFGFKVKVVEIETGPVIAQYEVELEAGLRLSRITGLADDLAIALRVPSVRIVAPIPGKNTVGIEVPNETRQVVRLREVLEESSKQVKNMRIPIFLGKDVSGNPMTVDLSTLPHLLIAGRTGTGKSVCLNAIISSILMTRRPEEVRMLMIDPKMVELSCYGRLPHLMHPVVTDMRKAEAILAWAVDKMEERYALLARAGVRHISSYNQLGKEELMERLEVESDEEAEAIPDHLPFIVIVADEMADLMMTAGKEVEQHIIRLAQKSRAVGIHLILATQKPTVDVITGLIKSNLPARIAFQVASRTDSRVVLDEMGADKLLGNGDMLFLWPGTSTLLRGQGTYLSDDEINSIVGSVSQHGQNFVNELVNMKVEDANGEKAGPADFKKRDELYESAIDIVVREGRGSVSLLQRSLGIGYGRAARLIDFMAEDGIVGPYAGSQAREILISVADWERMQGIEPEEEATAAEKPRRNKIRMEEDRPSSSEDEDEYEDVDDAYDEFESDEEDFDEEDYFDERYEAESA